MLLPLLPFAASSSTSGPSLLSKLSTSASLVVSALVAPFAFGAGLLEDELGFGAGRAALRCAGDEDEVDGAAAPCLPKKLNRVD